jgi:DNA polymerase-4
MAHNTQHTGFVPTNGLHWLFFDLNSYFASVEQQENPALMGRPVAVVPMMTDSTCAIAASYEAKRYGIITGTKIYEAKQMCPDLVCVLARHDVYVDYHHRILEELENHIHISKVCSIDEAACRLIGAEREKGRTQLILQNALSWGCASI